MHVEQADLAGEVAVERKESGERRVVGDVEKVIGKPDRKLKGLRGSRRRAGDKVRERLHVGQGRIEALSNDC